ncbi:MAG TPA: hypothetical protein VFB96_01900 [Pirellulaceae bacterium]|jgi:hypothetical protein|nr:hypothetical protein [Pirellulaceae bacterium]
MTTLHASALFRIAFLGVSLATIVTIGTGCRHITGMYNATLIRAQEWQDMSRIRQDTREELAQQREEARRVAAEREVEAARIEAERMRLEMEFCMANQEALQERVHANVREQVESKVAFNVVQGMEVGELEVDTEKLQELLKERERQPVQAPVRQPVRKPCECCDRPCGCEPGLLRRHCPRCCHKPCEAEQKCGGPEALREIEQQPLKQPLRAAEIPLKLPVRLSIGMQQPQMEAARIRRQPLIQQPVKQPCDGPNGYCPLPCTDMAPPQGAQPTVPTEIIPVPVPEPIEETRRSQESPYWKAHFGLVPRHSKSNRDVSQVSFLTAGGKVLGD